MRNSKAALALSTLAFAVSFAVWGLISPMSKTFQKMYHLTEAQVALMIAVPVLLGSIIRLPMGMLADRIGGRKVFGALLIFISLPAYMLSRAASYNDFLLWGLFLGMAGTSFSVGVSYTSRWFPPEKQGTALGIYGAGNIGQSLALFGVPVLIKLLGTWQQTFQVFALIALIYGFIFLALARDAESKAAPKSLGEMLRVLQREPLAWLLSLFYFVTFGGFVALSIYLPKLLQDKDLFALTREDASLRAAGFVLVATLMRPIGGALSDRFGGANVLKYVFAFAGALALLLTARVMPLFTVGALGIAACVGLGNGGVFKLVPQYFGKDTGTVTGLVGALGGLGGFFPPLVLGQIKQATGNYAAGFILLSLFCFVCLFLNYRVFLRPGKYSGTTQLSQRPAGA